MKFRSVFDIIGPVMIGPSSSHTAGAVRIGRVARLIFGRTAKQAEIEFCGSFAETYRGHGTDVAIVGGLLNFDTFDSRIKDALMIAKDIDFKIKITTKEMMGEHPNTAWITLYDEQESMRIKGVSIGGGKIVIEEVNEFELNLSGDAWTTLVFHLDQFGIIAQIANVLADDKINIGKMTMSRIAKGKHALLAIETDEVVTDEIGDKIKAIQDITRVRIIPPL